MLNLSRLYLLRELFVLGTIGKVAEAVQLTRPAVSQQLSILEQEVGTVLFERSGRGVRLTPAGESLAARAEQIFELVDEVESDLALMKGSVTGEVRISAFGSVAATLIPVAFSFLAQDFPQLHLQFEELEPSDSLKAVASKQVDLAIVDDSVSKEALATNLYFRPVCEDHLAVVMSARHRLASKPWVNIDMLADERWAINPSAPTFKTQIINACLDAGYTPKIVAKCRNMRVSIELARSSSVIAILPELALRTIVRDSSLRVVPIKPVMLRRVFVALAPGTFRRPAIAAVLRALDASALQFTRAPASHRAIQTAGADAEL